RQWLVARLGRERNASARSPRRHLPELRAHTSLQSGRNGRAAADFRGRCVVAVHRIEGRRNGDDPWAAGRSETTPEADGRDRVRQRFAAAGVAALPDRYPGRAGLLPKRRHPALRAAQTGGVIAGISLLTAK